MWENTYSRTGRNDNMTHARFTLCT